MKKKKEKTIAIKIWFVTMIMLGFSTIGCKFVDNLILFEKKEDKSVKMTKELAFQLLQEQNVSEETDVYLCYGAEDSILGPTDKKYIFERADGSTYCFEIDEYKSENEGTYLGYKHKKNEVFYVISVWDCVYNADAELVYDNIEELTSDSTLYIIYLSDGEFSIMKADMEKDYELDDVSLSENILFSINNGAKGYGMEWECTDATIMVYTDKTVHVFMDTDNNPEVCVLTLSDEDYEKLQKLTLPEAIMDIETEEELEAMDGSTYFIKLYGEDDKEFFVVGGYMPEGETFWKTYEEIKDILKPYGIEEEVEAYRNRMEEY